jgi:uncharacterized OsmC-like protein
MATDKRKMKVLITGESENPTRINLRAGKFTMIIDEPTSMGGTDAGPSPVQVLLLSLAGCLNVTGHEIARQKGFKLNGMKIRIEGVMNPCTFLGCSFEERAGFQEIDVKIDADFEGVSPEAQAQWLKETEERCPVTDNIKADTTVRVTLA